MAKIAIDLDNCLNNLTESLLKIYNADANDTLTLDNITEYKVENFVKHDWKQHISYYFKDNIVWEHVKPIRYSQHVVKQLMDDGHEVYIATASDIYGMPCKYHWLRCKFPFIQKENIIAIYHKQMLNVDFLIDDYIDNLTGGDYQKILLDYPWNHGYEQCDLIRVNNWNEIYQYITYGFRCKNKNVNYKCLGCQFCFDDDEGIYCNLRK